MPTVVLKEDTHQRIKAHILTTRERIQQFVDRVILFELDRPMKSVNARKKKGSKNAHV